MEYRFHQEIRIRFETLLLESELTIPFGAQAIVIFSFGGDFNHRSAVSRKITEELHREGFGTFVPDLLTMVESQVHLVRTPTNLLSERLVSLTKWLEKRPEAKDLRLAYFGAGSGATAAFVATSRVPDIAAVVSSHGRLAADDPALRKVQAPTLLIAGELDAHVLALNRQAFDFLLCPKKLEVIQGILRPLEDGNGVDQICALAAGWFHQYLPAGALQH